MKIAKEDVYQYVSWLIEIVAIIVSFSFNWGFGVLITIIIISSVWNYFLWEKIKRLRRDIINYEKLLGNEVPLYGLINYLVKNKSNMHLNKCRINELLLCVEVTGAVTKNKRNDLKFTWTLSGINPNSSDLDKIWFRFGGDNSVPFETLNFTYFDCTTNDSNCKLHGNDIFLCNKENTCKNEKGNYNRIIKENIYNLMELFFNQPIGHLNDFKIKLRYVWPQCYNTTCDYLILDPNNFSENVQKFTIKVVIDGDIITKNASIQMFSINKTDFGKTSEGKFNKDQENKYFYLDVIPNNDKIFFATIINNVNA